MATDVSADDFTTDGPALPLGDAPPVEAGDTAAPVESPVETPTPTDDDEPAPEAAAPADGKPAQAGERNPDGTFKAKGKKDPQARIDHVTWEREEARREAQAERSRREDLERRLAALEAPQRQPASPQARMVSDPRDPEPNPEDATKYPEGQYDRQYLKDQARWEANQVFRAQMQAVSAQAAQAREQQQYEARVASFDQRMQAVVATDPDFVSRLHPAVVNLTPTSQLKPGQTPTPLSDLAEELLDSPHTPQLLQHFSEHPDDLRRFAQLQTRAALLKEFTRLETRFETAPAGSVPKAPVLSQAKPPIRPVGSAPSASDEPPGDDTSFDEHVRYHNAKEKVPTPRRRR